MAPQDAGFGVLSSFAFRLSARGVVVLKSLPLHTHGVVAMLYAVITHALDANGHSATFNHSLWSNGGAVVDFSRSRNHFAAMIGVVAQISGVILVDAFPAHFLLGLP